jgi:hypothetical protein
VDDVVVGLVCQRSCEAIEFPTHMAALTARRRLVGRRGRGFPRCNRSRRSYTAFGAGRTDRFRQAAHSGPASDQQTEVEQRRPHRLSHPEYRSHRRRRHEVHGSYVDLSAEDRTIAEILKPLGYPTGQFGKNHLGDPTSTSRPRMGLKSALATNAKEEPELPDCSHPNR